MWWACLQPKTRDEDEEGFLLENGADLLRELISSCDGNVKYPLRIFSAEELKEATDNYAANYRILDTRLALDLCCFYRGIHEGRMITVKRVEITDYHDDERSRIINEVVMLSQISHKNVVKLLGCCLEAPIPILVYEFLSNGNLANHIHVGSQLSWEDRVRIATETAEALAYLHMATPKSIVHVDIRPKIIWLDEHFNSRVAGFELSVLIPEGESHVETETLMGTYCYIDPEYSCSVCLTEKSDVYSFGVVLVELLVAKSIEDSYRDEGRGFDPIAYVEKECLSVEGVTNQKTKCAELAVRCLQLRGIDRPTMKEVCQELRQIRRSYVPPTWP